MVDKNLGTKVIFFIKKVGVVQKMSMKACYQSNSKDKVWATWLFAW